MSPLFKKGGQVNEYVVLERIHPGGKSDIYFADDTKNRRKVALKIYHADVLTEDQKATLISRGRDMVNLDHPGAVNIFDVFEFEGCPVIVMEFCEGQSLKNLLAVFEASPDKATELIIQVLQAIEPAHQNDIIHGPVVPSQIIIGMDGRAKVIGFDEFIEYLPKPENGKMAIQRFPEYTAPEVLDRSAPDKKSDLFSVGVLLYELLAGESPFKGDNREESAELVKMHTPTAISKVNPELPYRLDDVTHRLLSKEPGQRYDSAAEAISVLQGVSIEKGEPAADKKPVDWWNRYVVSAAALVLLIIAILWILR